MQKHIPFHIKLNNLDIIGSLTKKNPSHCAPNLIYIQLDYNNLLLNKLALVYLLSWVNLSLQAFPEDELKWRLAHDPPKHKLASRMARTDRSDRTDRVALPTPF